MAKSRTPRRPAAPAASGAPPGATQQALLEALKRRGPATLLELAGAAGLARETVREHLNAMGAAGLVQRAGARRDGPGRPAILYRLAAAAHARFPQHGGAVLGELAAWLTEQGDEAVLKRFFEQRSGRRRAALRARVAQLTGRRRLDEVARILSEEGYMAEVDGGALRLCHCPISAVVAATRAPCRAELALVEDLLGRPLTRTDYLPDGGVSCSYSVGRRPR